MLCTLQNWIQLFQLKVGSFPKPNQVCFVPKLNQTATENDNNSPNFDTNQTMHITYES